MNTFSGSCRGLLLSLKHHFSGTVSAPAFAKFIEQAEVRSDTAGLRGSCTLFHGTLSVPFSLQWIEEWSPKRYGLIFTPGISEGDLI